MLVAVQDDTRENQAIMLFNLTQAEDRSRGDIDAYLEVNGVKINFELKSATGGSVSTVRDFGPDHIAKWRSDLHWIFAFYNKEGTRLKYCIYASPLDMEDWIADKERYVAPDFYLEETVPAFVTPEMVVEILGQKDVYSQLDARRIMKNQWTAQQYKENADVEILPIPGSPGSTSGKARKNPRGYSLAKMTEILQLRCGYVMHRGSTLNNPHIEAKYFEKFEKITSDHAATLRRLVGDYLAKRAEDTDEATA